jgi:hypothetical protein
MKTLARLTLCLLSWVGAAQAADSVEEMLVAGTRTEKTVVPGASLKRPADFLLQRFKVSSDAPEETARKDDILDTLRLLQSAANRDKTVELVILPDGRIVAPLRIDPLTLKVLPGNRSQTSEIVVAVKTRVVPGADNATALFSKLKGFPKSVKPTGRAAIDLTGDIELTLVNPAQFREPVIKLYAGDVRTVTAALGSEYRVVTKGIDRQLQWMRDGMTDVVIFIPYEYDVIPANVSSYTRAP